MNANSWKRFLLIALLISTAAGAFADEEQDIISTLKSTTDLPAKCAACQRLRLIGTEKSVPVLAELLADETTSHAARNALEGLPYPEAVTALRTALSKTSGLSKAGLIDSLGRRGDAASVPVIAPLLNAPDTNIASSAAFALGRIATAEALSSLRSALKNASPELQPAVFGGLLECADRMRLRGEKAKADEAYKALIHDRCPTHIRIAAWRGSVLLNPKNRAKAVLAGLTGKDEGMQSAACAVLRELDDASLGRACVSRWKNLPEKAQLAVLDIQASRRGSDGLKVGRLAMQSSYASVRIAALDAMSELAQANDVAVLVRIAAQADSAERDAAREALRRVHGRGVQDAFLKCLKDSNPDIQATVLRAFGDRGDAATASVLVSFAEKSPGQARAAALESLRKVAVDETAAPLVKLAATSSTEADLQPVLSALFAVCQATPDKEGLTRQVLGVMESLPDEGCRQVLPVLSELGTAEALKVAQAAAEAKDPEIARSGIRTLAQWPSAAPARSLIEIARSTPDPGLRALAVRSCIDLVRQEQDPTKRLDILKQAAALAGRKEEKIQALGQVGQITSPAALSVALGFLKEPGLENEAGLAAITIAEKLAGTHPALARETATTVLEKCKTGDVLKRAWSIRGSPVSAPFIQDWLVCGPYTKPGLDSALAAFNTPFGPEIKSQEVRWASAPRADHLNLMSYFPRQVNCAAFAKALLVSPESREAVLLMGSDDGLKAWLNGTVIHSNNVDRGEIPDQDVVPISLKSGTNELMLKISQGGGGWSARARVAGLDGQPVSGLQVVSLAGAAPAAVLEAKPAPAPLPTPSSLPPREPFKKLHLTSDFVAEGAYFADFNNDGQMDVLAGPFWFAGPDFTMKHKYRPVKTFNSRTEYSDNFLNYAGHFNGDNLPDVLLVPFPGKEAYWFENSGKGEGHWKQHLVYTNVGNESPIWVDVTGDSKPELLCNNEGYLGYLEPNRAEPEKPWPFRAISTQEKRYQRFTHGVGAGDIDGDGRMDIVESAGWWEHPANDSQQAPWKFHPFGFAEAGAQMLVYDVDGDTLSDVITSWHCHLYGMVWWRQVKTAQGERTWKQEVILPSEPDLTSSNFRISQMHALDLVDMNGDGLKDILTGKRFWSHGPTGDKEPDAPAVVFWFELQRKGDGVAGFVPRLIDDDSGVGTQVAATDLNNDARPDVMVANKKGIFIHLSQSGSRPSE